MRGLRRFVNVPRELGYNAGMRSKRSDWVTWGIIAVGLAFGLYLSFGYRDPARDGTPEQKAEAAYEHRAGQMQN